MAADDIWILGIRMTKFGKHPDRDTIDLAAEATMAALADGGVWPVQGLIRHFRPELERRILARKTGKTPAQAAE